MWMLNHTICPQDRRFNFSTLAPHFFLHIQNEYKTAERFFFSQITNTLTPYVAYLTIYYISSEMINKPGFIHIQ